MENDGNAIDRAPRLTAEQAAAGVEESKRVRSERKRIKARLKSGELAIGDVMARRGEKEFGGMRVAQVIGAVPGWGEARTEQVMDEIGIMPTRKVGGLTERQAAALRERVVPGTPTRTAGR